MDAARREILEEPLEVVLPDGDRTEAVHGERRLEQPVSERLGDRPDDADAQDRAPWRGAPARHVHELGAGAEDVVRVGRDLGPERREDERAAAPLEERSAQERLEGTELRAQRGVREVEPRRPVTWTLWKRQG